MNSLLPQMHIAGYIALNNRLKCANAYCLHISKFCHLTNKCKLEWKWIDTEISVVNWPTPKISDQKKTPTVPALMLHKPHSAFLYATMLSLQQRRIAPDNHTTGKRRPTRCKWMQSTDSLKQNNKTEYFIKL